MRQYLKMLRHIQKHGNDRGDRTGTGTRSVFGYQTRFDLAEGFPLITTKKMPWRIVVHELLWFISGETSIRPLLANNVKIWTDWPLDRYRKATGNNISQDAFEALILEDEKFAKDWGDLGPVYGKQWRFWEDGNGNRIDQLQDVIDRIRRDPESRRLIVNAWNVADLPAMALPPCHSFYQFYVSNGTLSCELYQRSADVFLGVPFNIASYSLLTMMVAQVCGLKPGEFIHSFGDLHRYNNHKRQVRLQLTRKPFSLPKVRLNPERREIDEFVFEDFTLENYQAHSHIAAPVSV